MTDRELLAAEYEAIGYPNMARMLRAGEHVPVAEQAALRAMARARVEGYLLGYEVGFNETNGEAS